MTQETPGGAAVMAEGSVDAAPASLGAADYRLIIESVVDYAIFQLDPQGNIQSWNEGARRTKQYEASEVIGRHFSMFYPQDMLDRKWPEHELEVALATGRFEDEGWRIRRDGSRFWANIIITRLIDAGGIHRGFSKITRDLSERRRQEELLRLSEERFRLLVEGVTDYAIFMLDPDGRIVSWNSGAQKNKGYAASEIIGQHFSVFYPSAVVESGWPAEELRLALQDGSFEDEGWRVRKDGTRFWASIVLTALHDDAGRHIGFAKVTRDLTERRKIVSLEDESRRIAAFLAMLGHELRNPLAPIANALGIMQMAEGRPEPILLAREVIERQLRQMTRLVDDLLDVGRITSGKIHLALEPVDAQAIALEALEAIQPQMQAKHHSVNLQINDAGLWIRGDRARLIQAISNLLSNAAKFTAAHGRITLRVQRSGTSVEIAVKDNGPGIAPTLLPRIFGLFVQGEQDASRSLGGLGLGLSLVRQLVIMHGGDITAHSSGIAGEGAEFTLRLPAVARPPEPPRAKAELRAVPHKRILVVDDNMDAALTMQLVLEGMGYRVTVAHDGPAAIEAAKLQRPDAMLLDIGLPGLSGLEVAERLGAEMTEPPLMIAVTGYGQDRDREASLAAGFQAHLTKPVTVAQISELLRKIFA